MNGSYRCAVQSCTATFLHPDTHDDCPTTARGRCAHLVGAGWVPVTLRIELDRPGAHRVHIVSSGGWICPGCAGRYVPATQRRLF